MLGDIKAKLDGFSPAKVAVVAKTVDSLSNPPRAEIRTEGTWLTDPGAWVEHFGLALSVHHGATAEPLGRTSFETAFRGACEHMGWPVEVPGSANQRFYDMTVRAPDGPPRRLALKSTAVLNISASTVHISKLTKAAWSQEKRTPAARRAATLALFRDYRKAVDAIMMLRAFRSGEGEVPCRYQLVEVPAGMFDSVQQAPLSDFEGPVAALDCRLGGRDVARVAVDGPGRKITVRRIRIAACTVHAEWRPAAAGAGKRRRLRKGPGHAM